MRNDERDAAYDVVFDGAHRGCDADLLCPAGLPTRLSIGVVAPAPPRPSVDTRVTADPAAVRELLDRAYPRALPLADIAAACGCIPDVVWKALARLLDGGVVERVDAPVLVGVGSPGRPPRFSYRARMGAR